MPRNYAFLEASGLGREEAHPMHYHIRWSNGKLDWERYGTVLKLMRAQDN